MFPCPRSCLRIWPRETGSPVPSRVSLLTYILRLNLALTYYGIPSEFRGGVHLFIYKSPYAATINIVVLLIKYVWFCACECVAIPFIMYV